ncbi:MAG: cupin domain-containing protein [Dehalococcoidia bacterium]
MTMQHNIDAAQASPECYSVMLENDHVRVLDMRIPAGQSDETHSHPNETVYFVTGGKARINMPDGQSVELDIPDGHIMWHEPWTHRVENIGTTEIHAIVVEGKP